MAKMSLNHANLLTYSEYFETGERVSIISSEDVDGASLSVAAQSSLQDVIVDLLEVLQRNVH